MGDVEGPSVVVKVIFAFLLPLVVFIVSLAAFQEIFSKAIESQRAQTAFSFLLALVATFICILIIRVVRKRISGLEN
ncbi:MAG: SoxR reducing system RseC family protein [Phycisphaerae bacterium]